MSDEITMRHVGEVTGICERTLRASWGQQHTITSSEDLNPYAFEFWWPAFGVEGARRLKVVVSDAENVGVENMAYPPPKLVR
jgi:hypothetical protein